MADINSTCRDYYVYLHRRATDGRVFYVGKGFGRRCKSKAGRSDYWHRIVAKHGLTIELVEVGLQEWFAFELEAELIALYGRSSLCNLTDGGDGPSGYSHKDESKAKMAIAKTGVKLGPMSEDHRKKISLSQAGKPRQKHGPEARSKISEALRNRRRSEETNSKISAALTGKRISESVRSNLVKAHGGAPILCIETGMVFLGASPAARWLQSIGNAKASAGAVSNAALGRASHAYGYRFQRIDQLAKLTPPEPAP